MIKIPFGKYSIGTNENIGYPEDKEGPQVEVEISSFEIDETTVSNRMFLEFIEETDYVTEAEQLGSSFVFYKLLTDFNEGIPVPGLPWWREIVGANWKKPFGETSSYLELLDHPVVHITVLDALMYCQWADKRLPTEIEWVVAALGGEKNSLFPWGNELNLNNQHYCNIWQGNFPHENTLEDGYLGTSPVKSFHKNRYGIYQMVGNVWEICFNEAKLDLDQIRTISKNDQLKEYYANMIDKFAMKGGSFLCHHSYCNRYRIDARSSVERQSSSSNVGFRCVR